MVYCFSNGLLQASERSGKEGVVVFRSTSEKRQKGPAKSGTFLTIQDAKARHYYYIIIPY